MTPVAKREQTLRKRLAFLEQKMEAIETALEQPMDQDVEERSVEREGDEVMQDMGNADLLETRQIQAALERISAGEYGYCVECGAKISEERLDLLPQTPFCQTCASQHD